MTAKATKKKAQAKVNPNLKRENQEKQEKALIKQEEKVKTKVVKDIVVKIDEETII